MAVKCMVMSASDNVAVALDTLAGGDRVVLAVGPDETIVEIKEAISFGHKFSLGKIFQGEEITKYGTAIGLATQIIEAGFLVHTHNVEGFRARGDKQ